MLKTPWKRVIFKELIGAVEDVPCVMWGLEVNTLLKWTRRSSLLWFREILNRDSRLF
jgi:hypothetical protein